MNENNYSENELSVLDILEFIQESWKQVLFTGFVGSLLGFGGWFFLGNYQADLMLQNNYNASGKNYYYGLDIVSWRSLEKSLPNLANQQLSDGKLSPDQAHLLNELRESSWWSKNIVPIYAISKADVKNLAAISKDFDSASTTIVGFSLKANGRSKEAALQSVQQAAQFLKTGGAFLQIKSTLNHYQSEVIATSADIQSQISTAEIEQTYLRERVKNLEDLLKRFPVSSNVSQQVVDPKDSGAKYLPLTTQIIAVNNDINQNKEHLIRLNFQLNQIALMKQFLIEAIPLAENEYDGILLCKSLLSIEERLRKGLPAADLQSRQALDQLRRRLLIIEARFTMGLEANIQPIAKKTGMLKAIAGGFAAAVFLMLVFLLGRNTLRRKKIEFK